MKQIIDRSGRVRSMPDRYARILVRAGRSSYLTRDMVADAPVVVTPAEVAPDEAIFQEVAPAAAETAGEAPKKRRYKRRDQVAKE